MRRTIAGQMRIRDRLLMLLLSVLIPAFIAAAVATAYVYQAEQASEEQALVGVARSFALLINNEIETKEAILHTLAQSPLLVQGDLKAFHAYARAVAPSSETTIILLLGSGEQLLNTRVPFGTPLPKRTASDLPELTRQYGADKTIVSDVYLSSIARRLDFAIQVPIAIGDGVTRFLVMGINASEFEKMMAAQRFPKQWIATIVDRKGQVVARSRNPEQYVGRTIRDYSRRILGASHDGMYPSMTLDGIAVRVFFSEVPITEWRILISTPSSNIQKGAIRASAFLAGVMSVLLIFAFFAARRLARNVIEPIEALGQAAGGLGRGEPVTYQERGLREVDIVGHTMVQASKQIQQSTLELQDRIDKAVSSAQRAERALLQSQKLEALGRLTGGIAHDFNNLLQTIATSLQLVKMTTKEPRTESLIQTSQKAVDRAGTLTRQLSAFGRVQDARLETVDIKARIIGFLQLIEGALPSNIRFEVYFADAIWPVTVDCVQLELALLNIALNARDAMPTGGILRLDVSNVTFSEPVHGLPHGDYVLLCMTDNGSGMTPNALSRAMDPFFTTKPVGKGSGMGLTQAYGFATQSSGTLTLRSIEGEGTSVEIYLPKVAETIPISSTPQATHPRPVVGEHQTVLFVEDNDLVRESVVPALRDAGIEVVIAETGDAALKILNGGQRINALFSDIVMPGKTSGIELAAIVKARFPAVKVILATGYSEKRVTLPGVQVLAKPYEIHKVIELLSSSEDGT